MILDGVKAVTFDAYGTLLQNPAVVTIAEHIVADHGLAAPADDVARLWIDFYYETTQLTPFRTLREIEGHILRRVLRRFDVDGDVAPYVDLFFQATTVVAPYPEALAVLNALRHVRCAIVSNADHEHLAAWSRTFPVEFILISEAVQVYKPNVLMFRHALERFALEPHEVLHVGDSEVDDVQGAKAAGLRVAWVNRDGRAPRPGVPAPDFEIRDLTELPRLF